ncbi:MAG: hypothetical protein R2774_09045 [Saprospiraceae bacterium]
MRSKIYGMEQLGTTIETATHAVRLVEVDVKTQTVTRYGEIPPPANIYGTLGVSGIMVVGDVDKEGNYYFPAINAFINPTTAK